MYFAPFETQRQKLLCSLFTWSMLGCLRHKYSLCMASNHSHVFRFLIQSKKLICSQSEYWEVQSASVLGNSAFGDIAMVNFIPFPQGKKSSFIALALLELQCTRVLPPADATLHLMSLFLGPLADWGCDWCHELLLLSQISRVLNSLSCLALQIGVQNTVLRSLLQSEDWERSN